MTKEVLLAVKDLEITFGAGKKKNLLRSKMRILKFTKAKLFPLSVNLVLEKRQLVGQ